MILSYHALSTSLFLIGDYFHSMDDKYYDDIENKPTDIRDLIEYLYTKKIWISLVFSFCSTNQSSTQTNSIMLAGRHTSPTVNAFIIIDFNHHLLFQCSCRAGFNTSFACSLAGTACAGAVFPAAFFIINFNCHILLLNKPMILAIF